MPELRPHWHGGVDHLVITALGVMLVWQVIRMGAGALATNENPQVAAAGKAVGGLFSFPAQ